MYKQNFSKVSDHFSTRDFVCACGVGTNEFKLSLGLIGGLELLRSQTHKRINILKGYVCSDCSTKQKSVKRDYHNLGLAADITADGMDIIELFKNAELVPEFMGIGLNITEKSVHVDTRKGKERQLWIEKLGERTDLTPTNREEYLGK